MSISTEQAEQMVREKMEREAKSAQPEQSEKPETEPSTPEPKAEEPKDPEPEQKNEEVPHEEPKKEPEEPKPEVENPEKDKEKSDKKIPPKQKYSHAERVAHAFSIEKQKRKEQHAKDQARIKELEDRLKKYEGLKLEDFGENGQSEYLDWKLDERDMRNEVKQTKERIEREEAEDLQKETERRIALSFEDEDEREEYNELIRKNGNDFREALDKYDPEGVVLGYLSSVEKYPLVLRELMTNMETLGKVFKDADPTIRRINLHKIAQDIINGKKEPETKPVTETKAVVAEQPKPEPPKPAIPVIGKQVTAAAKPTEPVHDRAYWNNYLLQHP